MKKGFTLIELLAVVAIISILLILIIPSVNKIISNVEEKGYALQIDTIKDGAMNFALEYTSILSSSHDFDSFIIDLKLLKDLSFVDFEIKNPKTNQFFSDDTSIILTREKDIYKVEVLDYDSDTIYDEVKYDQYIILLKNSSTVSNEDVMLLTINGGVCTKEYTVNTSVGDPALEGYTTNIYNINVESKNYAIKRFTKVS